MLEPSTSCYCTYRVLSCFSLDTDPLKFAPTGLKGSRFRLPDTAWYESGFLLYIVQYHFSNLDCPLIKTSFPYFYNTGMSTQPSNLSTQHAVMVTSAEPEHGEVTVWRPGYSHPDVISRIYPTVTDAAWALGWYEDSVRRASNSGVVLHTSTPIDYDRKGQQSMQDGDSCLE